MPLKAGKEKRRREIRTNKVGNLEIMGEYLIWRRKSEMVAIPKARRREKVKEAGTKNLVHGERKI